MSAKTARKRALLSTAAVIMGVGLAAGAAPAEALTAHAQQPAAVAVVDSAAPASVHAAARCSKWIDYNYGRGRAHAKCSGYIVHVNVKCANGKWYSSKPYWRYGYNKGECPKGVGAVGMTTRLR
jgi:hypothetical protein